MGPQARSVRQADAAVSRGGRRAGVWALALLALVLASFASIAAADSVVIPNLWDPRARPERPDLAMGRTLRFLTDEEFPPLHFAGPDGNPTGFAVEVARAVCERLGLTCTIQARRFDTLLEALADGRGDVVAAAVPVTASLRQRFAVTQPYLRLPARFAVRKDRNAPEPGPAAIANRTVGVAGGTAHEAYLAAFFPDAERRTFPNLAAAQGALQRGEIDYLFGDGLALALWIGGSDSADCCALSGGPYLESRFFGEGIGFVLRKEDEALRRAIDAVLQRLWDQDRYAELYLRFFPISPF